MAQVLDALCVGKTTLDQFLVIDKTTFKCRLDPQTGFLSIKHGEKIEVEKFEFCMGGNATNVAVGLSRLGVAAALCSEIGDDEFGTKIRNWLSKEKIDTSFIVKVKNTPSSYSVILNFRGERTIFTQRFARENNFDLDDVMPRYVFLTSLDNEWKKPYAQVIAHVIKKGSKLAFNPGTVQLRHGKDIVLNILKYTDILFVNKEEAEEIVWGHEKRKRENERSYIRELLVRLNRLGAKTAVVTNGRYGSNAIDETGNFYHEGLYPGEVVERTGAGDSYSTGFLAAVIYGKSIKEAMKWGGVNSSSVVGKIGAEAGLLTREELEKRGIGVQASAPVENDRFGNIFKFMGRKLKFG